MPSLPLPTASLLPPRTTVEKGELPETTPRYQAQSSEAACPVNCHRPGQPGSIDVDSILARRMGRGQSPPGNTLPLFALLSLQLLIAEPPNWISSNGAVTVVPAPAGAQELPAHFLYLAQLWGLEGWEWGLGWRLWEWLIRATGIRTLPCT